MPTRRSDFKDAVERLRKLKALQAKATDKLDRIGKSAAGKAPKKKTPRPAVKKKTRAPAKKPSFWQKLFGKKKRKK